MDTEEIIKQETNESIKLEKNSKGYNWSIRLNPIECRDLDSSGQWTGKMLKIIGDTDIDRLKILNERMMKEFGSLTE